MWLAAGIGLATFLILTKLRTLHMDINEVQAKLSDLKTSVDAPIAFPTNPPPVDLQPLGDQIDAIKAEVDAKLAS